MASSQIRGLSGAELRRAFREAFDGADLASVGSRLIWEFTVGICYGLLGYLLFRIVEVDARRRGAYETSIL